MHPQNYSALNMEKQHEKEGLDVGGEANKPDVGGAIVRRESGNKLLGYEDSENNADGVKEAHADTIPDDDKSKHPRLKARAHKSDSENSDEEEEEDSENADNDSDDNSDTGDWMDKVDPLEIKKRELKMEKQSEEGLDVGGEANESELEGAIESGDDDDKLLGYQDFENNADGVKKEAHAVYTLTPGKPTIPDDDDDKSKHPRPKARAHKADSDNGEEEEEEEDSENADEDTDDEMHDDHDDDNVDDEYGYSFMSQLKKRPDLPSSEAFPASLLSYVQETHCHDRPPSTNTVLLYILEDEEGLARDNSYPVWEMERQKRKMKLERVSMSYSNLMKLE